MKNFIIIAVLFWICCGFSFKIHWNHLNEGNCYKIYARSGGYDFDFDKVAWDLCLEEEAVNIETVTLNADLKSTTGEYVDERIFLVAKCFKEVDGNWIEVNKSNEVSVIANENGFYELSLIFKPLGLRME